MHRADKSVCHVSFLPRNPVPRRKNSTAPSIAAEEAARSRNSSRIRAPTTCFHVGTWAFFIDRIAQGADKPDRKHGIEFIIVLENSRHRVRGESAIEILREKPVGQLLSATDTDATLTLKRHGAHHNRATILSKLIRGGAFNRGDVTICHTRVEPCCVNTGRSEQVDRVNPLARVVNYLVLVHPCLSFFP